MYEGYEGYKGRQDIFYKKLDTFLRGVQSVQGVRGIRDYFSENQTPFRRVYKVYKVYRGCKVHSQGGWSTRDRALYQTKPVACQDFETNSIFVVSMFMFQYYISKITFEKGKIAKVI